MEEILQANIFFFITSVAVVLFTIAVLIALYFIIAILKNLRDITLRVRRGSEALETDLHELRMTMKEKGAHLKDIFRFFSNHADWFPKKKKKEAKAKE